MSEVVRFAPRAEMDARQRVAAFVFLARDRLTALVPSEGWDADSWDVSGSFVRKGKPNVASRLRFFRQGTMTGRGEDAVGEPFERPFGDFARSSVRYQHSCSPTGFERLEARLRALCHLDAAFRLLGRSSDVTRLSHEVLFAAVRISGEGAEGSIRYQRAVTLQQLHRFCGEHGFLATPFVWRHGVRKAADANERIGEEFARRREAKLPSMRALDALALAYREPKTVRDNLMSAVTLICMCAPIRIHEVLQLAADCMCEDQRRDGEGRPVQAVGFRVLPGKGNAPQIKWVPDVMASAVKEAVDRLSGLGAAARQIAGWYVRNPTSMYLPPDARHLRAVELICSADLGRLVGTADPWEWARNNGLRFTRNASGQGYPFADLERVVLAQLPRDFPLHNGQRRLPYSGSLILVRHGSLRADTIGTGSRVMFEPIGVNTYSRWLSGTPDHKTIFERYGFVQEDGSDIKITSHGFRHWLNDVGHRRGLSAMDIAQWSARDPAQNKYYDHQTPAQFHAQLLDMVEKAGGIGPLFEAADALPENGLISRSEFLAAQIGSAHHTDLGACIHDYSLLPCQRFGNCLGCEENAFIKGEPKHRAMIADRRTLTAAQLEAARAVMDDGEYGADLWVRDHEASLARLDLMLSIHDDPAIADGVVVTLPADGGDTEVSLALRERDARAKAG